MAYKSECIFNIKNLIRIVAVIAICAMSGGAYAYYDDEDDEDIACQYFSPAYALCTIHSYNVGMAKNPTDAGQIADMNEVIALKSTVIAQQMKQEYDFLNAMVKRFKTQLEKAVLTSKIEVLTGGSSSGSSGSVASSNNGGLATAEDCDDVGWKNVHDCLRRNLNKINQAAEKDISNARKQLAIDFSIARDYHVCDRVNDNDPCDKCSNRFASDRPTGNKKEIQDCVSQLKRQVDIAKTNYERENSRSRYNSRDY